MIPGSMAIGGLWCLVRPSPVFDDPSEIQELFDMREEEKEKEADRKDHLVKRKTLNRGKSTQFGLMLFVMLEIPGQTVLGSRKTPASGRSSSSPPVGQGARHCEGNDPIPFSPDFVPQPPNG
jgi:hypothetical protein